MSDHAPRDESSVEPSEAAPSTQSDTTLTGILLLIPLGIGCWLLYWGLSSLFGPPANCGWIGCIFDFTLPPHWAVIVSCGGGILAYGSIRSLLRL